MRYYDDKNGLYYEIKDDASVIVDADKKLGEIIVPNDYDGKPVTMIAKKAFLGCKALRRLVLPDRLEKVGDWAFAYCDNLTEIEFCRSRIIFEKGVFKNDEKLNLVMLRDGVINDSKYDSINKVSVGKLLAVTTSYMESEFLFDTEDAGSDEWYHKWDTRLSHILTLADEDGYYLYVLCGEEDLHFDFEEFLEYKRFRKSALCMLRLIYDDKLDAAFREELKKYLVEHTIGCESIAAFKCLMNLHGDDREFYELMVNINAINRDNLERVLETLGDRHAEMKSYLIEAFNDTASDDFFDDLML